MCKISIFFLCFFTILTTSCSIISDEDLDDLPENIRVSSIDLVFVNSVDSTLKTITVPLVYSGNTLEINWPDGFDAFFYNENITKTVYQLNANGYAEKITNTFEDGVVMEDVFTYNSDELVAEQTNSFFNDHLVFYYDIVQLVNNATEPVEVLDNIIVIDSIAKKRTLDNAIQFGFYKFLGASGGSYYEDLSDYYAYTSYGSIFPFDESQTPNFGYVQVNCETTSIAANVLNRTLYTIQTSFYRPGLTQSLETYFITNKGSYICPNNYYFGFSGEFSYYNVYRDLYSISIGSPNDCPNCGYSNQGYLNSYQLLPALFPNNSQLNMVNADNELKWIAKNNPNKEALEWRLGAIYYDYEPVN